MIRDPFAYGGALPAFWLDLNAPSQAFLRLRPPGGKQDLKIPDGEPFAFLESAKIPDIDLAKKFWLTWPVSDQGAAPNCIAHAICACLELSDAIANGHAAPTRLSAQFLYAASRKYPPKTEDKGWEEGGTRFQNAIIALRENGVCRADAWPNRQEGPPTPATLKLAETQWQQNLKDSVSEDPRKELIGPEAIWVATNLSALIVAELDAKRPLGLAFPIYPTGGSGNNWLDALLADGTVTFPAGVNPDKDAISGHAVCVTGVRPDKEAEGGGWIIFRNSVGASFPRRAVAGMTGFGYGRMSLADANRHCWDLFTLRPNDESYEPSSGSS